MSRRQVADHDGAGPILRAFRNFPRMLPRGYGTVARWIAQLARTCDRVVVRTALGPTMMLDLGQDYHRYLYFGVHERATTAVLRHLLIPGTLFLDAGANVGYFSLLAASLCEKNCVLAFEADPRYASVLRENVALNGFTNLGVHAVALGNRCGTAQFVLADESGSGSSLETGHGAIARLLGEQFQRPVPVVDVPITTLDAGWGDTIKGWPGRVVLKLDIEGSEPDALEGACGSLPHIDAAIVEQNPCLLGVHGHAPHAVAHALGAAGLRTFLIEERWGRPVLRAVDGTFDGQVNLLALRTELANEVSGTFRILPPDYVARPAKPGCYH